MACLIAGVLCWVAIGVALGQWSLGECVSLEWDEATKGATILFPFSVLLFGEGIMCPAFWFWSSHRPGIKTMYRVLVVVFWPLKIAWSLCGLLVMLSLDLIAA